MIKKALRPFLISIALFIYSASALASGTSGGLLTVNPDLNLINEVFYEGQHLPAYLGRRFVQVAVGAVGF